VIIKDLPITPEVLRWAREDRELALAMVGGSFGKNSVRDWEEGRSRPSLAQLESLSKIFRRAAEGNGGQDEAILSGTLD
jgi:DNA-binding transcriptional regulator YiaG